jgi:hypothetical protein
MLSALPTLLVLVLPSTQATTNILYYDPDTNQERIAVVSALFNKYLERAAPGVVFEPMASEQALQRRIDDPAAKFAIVKSTYLRRNKDKLVPLLVPEGGGSIYYHKVLVDSGDGPPTRLSNKTIAAAMSGDEAKGFLAYLKSQALEVDGAFVVSVTKDVDALLAMTFGQADAALVTENSIAVLKQSNPNAVSKLRVLLHTGDILRAPLCEIAQRASAGERAAMVKTLASLQDDTAGKRLLDLLGADRWLPYTPGMLK